MSDATHLLKDARRIVACVNACAGIPTAALERWTLVDLLGDVQLEEIARLRAETAR